MVGGLLQMLTPTVYQVMQLRFLVTDCVLFPSTPFELIHGACLLALQSNSRLQPAAVLPVEITQTKIPQG